MALKQQYYQVIAYFDYEGCIWAVYIDPGLLKRVIDSGGQAVSSDAIYIGGPVTTTPPLDNPPYNVLYIPSSTADPQVTKDARTLYREGLGGKLSAADQAKQTSVRLNIYPGVLVDVNLIYESRHNTEIVHVDLQPQSRKFDLGKVTP